MYLPVDAHGLKWGMGELFSENFDCQIANTDKGWMSRVDGKTISDDLQFEPIRSECSYFWLGNLQFCGINCPFRKKILPAKPRRRKDGRVEIAD